jgi:hypothetical protein
LKTLAHFFGERLVIRALLDQAHDISAKLLLEFRKLRIGVFNRIMQYGSLYDSQVECRGLVVQTMDGCENVSNPDRMIYVRYITKSRCRAKGNLSIFPLAPKDTKANVRVFSASFRL